MIKIIKRGKKDFQDPTYRHTCACGCVFTFKRGDMSNDQREPQPWIRCPTCLSNIDDPIRYSERVPTPEDFGEDH